MGSLHIGRRTDADPPNRHPVVVGLAGSGPDHLERVLGALDATDGLAVRDD